MQKKQKYKYLAKVLGINKNTGETVTILFKLKSYFEFYEVLNCDYPGVLCLNYKITEL